MNTTWNGPQIHSWQKFARKVRQTNTPLLGKLDEFPNSILVTGCQRSGTTMLARVVSNGSSITNYGITKDDELAAALILSGYVSYDAQGRHCFQTTYLNENLPEYFQLSGQHRIVWVIRSPMSVVYSMVYNWKRFALNELFLAVGKDQLTPAIANRFHKYGLLSVSPIQRACYAYNGKVKQLDTLLERWPNSRLFVVDYDQLVTETGSVLPRIFDFLDLPYSPETEKSVLKTSLTKAEKMPHRHTKAVESICSPVYQNARRYLTET
jgi:hypothetical protein